MEDIELKIGELNEKVTVEESGLKFSAITFLASTAVASFYTLPEFIQNPENNFHRTMFGITTFLSITMGAAAIKAHIKLNALDTQKTVLEMMAGQYQTQNLN